MERAAVSVLGMIQPGTLARSFGRAEREAGLLGRLLMANPPEIPAKWHNRSFPNDVAENWQHLLECLLGMQPVIDDDGSQHPRLIPLGPEAEQRFSKWFERHEREDGVRTSRTFIPDEDIGRLRQGREGLA